MDLYYLGRPDQPGNFGLTPAVPNLSIRATWAYLEPAAGQYQWNNIDAGVRAAGNNKVALTLSTGRHTPIGWVKPATIAGTFKGQRVTYPVPWDSNYVTAVNNVVAELGARYAGLLKLDRITVSYLCTQTPELYLDSSEISLAEWQAVGYSHTLAQTTLENGVSAVARAFPGVKVVVAWKPGNGGLTFDAAGGKSLIGQLHNWFNMQANVANMNCGSNATWVMPMPTVPPYVCQTSKSLLAGIDECITLCEGAGVTALEVYPPDVPYVGSTTASYDACAAEGDDE